MGKRSKGKSIPSQAVEAAPEWVNRTSFRWLSVLAAIVIIGGVALAVLLHQGDWATQAPATIAPSSSGPANLVEGIAVSPPASQSQIRSDAKFAPEVMNIDVAKAVMVTVELDFGTKIPTIEAALREIERRYQPDDGQGRTFAILDAYGEPMPDGKLHMSMHVSTEKPGQGWLVFKRTGEVLWHTRISAGTSPPSMAKNLMIFLDDGKGRGQILDGSNNPSSILDTRVRDLGVLSRQFWPDGAERELTFIYSACGCPVKVMARRMGERTVRTKDLPVIFPDDPAAVSTIARLMRW